LLLERFVDPVILSHAETNFSPESNDGQRIKARWNERSLADWARIQGVLLAGGLLPCDLQLLLEETGRLVVIDPEMFQMARHIRPNDSFVRERINEIAEPLAELVPIPRYHSTSRV